MNKSEKTPFSIILVESALEPLDFLVKNRNISKKSRQKSNKSLEGTLLDASKHNYLMQNLQDKNKRGRPDIIHTALLTALDSRLNKEGKLRIYIHTRNDEIITINPEVRIPRNYIRFVGLMEQLFEVKEIPPNSEQKLIAISSQTLEGLVHTLNPKLVVLFTEKGVLTADEKLRNIFSENQRVVCLIGGFPHGEISQKIAELPDMKLSIYSKPLTTLVVVSSVIHIAEQALKINAN